MRAVYSFESLADSSGGPGTTARQLAESLSSLALPEDYALQVGTYRVKKIGSFEIKVL